MVIALSPSFIYLYTFFVLFLQAKDPDHAKLLVLREGRRLIYRNIELRKNPRIQLLRQLEDKRWKCCVMCMNLHRSSAFKPPKHPKESN
ncbi:unnamed protein product [Penicillium roqueforti FM164]|uniref:Genomic scaffold, ProqFM164S01 n=1 Tax=Penicillium roqueforti (strain FM164) TaxID=1365484 RepID=W6PY33_PENRF|nr:unnamed protein product [Penicillium roqueforti FM164]